jgi:hypothetical protein
MPLDPTVAVAFLTEENLRTIGKNLEHVYPIDDTPAFADLLAAIDKADRERRPGRRDGDHSS